MERERQPNPIQETQLYTEALEHQFDSPETVELAGGAIEYVDVIPEIRKTDVPVFMAPGWGCVPETYKYNMLYLAQQKRRVMSVKAPHGIEQELKVGEQSNYPAIELRKVAAILNMLEAKGIEKVDGVGHSEAGIYMLIAATMHPEKFRNIVLVDPAGIIGEDNVARLGIGFAKNAVQQTIEVIRDKKKEKTAASMLTFLKVIFSNPVASLKEVLAIANSDIRDMLRELKEKGIGISVIHAIDDKGFPMERVQKELGAHHIDGFYSVKGSHNLFFIQPQTYTPAVEHALDAMEKKQEQKTSS